MCGGTVAVGCMVMCKGGRRGRVTEMSQKFDFLVVFTFGGQLTGRGAVGQGVEGRRVSIVLWCASRCE